MPLVPPTAAAARNVMSWYFDFSVNLFILFYFYFFLSPSYPYEGSLAWWVGDEPVLFGPPSLPSSTCFFPGYFFPFFPPCMSILAHARGMFLSPELWLPFLFIYLFIYFVLVSFVVSLFYKVFWFNEKNTKGGGGETGGVEGKPSKGMGAGGATGGIEGRPRWTKAGRRWQTG